MIHREGRLISAISFVVLLVLGAVALFVLGNWAAYTTIASSIVLFALLLYFFRNPKRTTVVDSPWQVVAPVDGKVVVSQEVFQREYLDDSCYQISIFMSPLNVHVTRYPVSGKVVYAKYHPGKYLVAWHPKSAEKNERTTVVIGLENGQQVLYKQIAGTLARRIVNYAKVGDPVVVGADSGFIKFGSRLDILLPIDAEIEVKIGQRTRGGETLIAELKAESR
ncbi:MAG: phosphatidylserine decarboxylase family protein [Flavobacteriales bacterium]